MKIISYNVNGIRAAMTKGLLDWLTQEDPDILCLQETKAVEEQVDTAAIEALGYHHEWYSAQKKGYSGVAILSKKRPDAVHKGMGISTYDDEGRWLRADFGELSVVSAYFPSGSSGDARQEVKMCFLRDTLPYVTELRQERPGLIVCGDYNICHKAIDIHNPTRNKNTSGFLPEEREWMDEFVNSGMVDTFREFDSGPDNYSWWSYRSGARKKNLGWRIDYIMVAEELKDRLEAAEILADVVHSDHCPVSLSIR